MDKTHACDMAIGKIRKICIAGAGTMGHQVALQCSLHNYEVHLVDISKEALEKAKERIGKILEERAGLGDISHDSMKEVLSRIRCDTDLEKAARDADFVIEAVAEDVEAHTCMHLKIEACADSSIHIHAHYR